MQSYTQELIRHFRAQLNTILVKLLRMLKQNGLILLLFILIALHVLTLVIKEEINLFSDVVVPNEDDCQANPLDTHQPRFCKSPWWNGPKAFIARPVIEPSCQEYSKKSHVIYSYSATYSFRERLIIRTAFRRQFTDQTVALLFVVGQQIETNWEYERMLNEEHSQYRDILKLNTTDSYHRLGYKGIGTLAWLDKCGHQSKFYTKIDDDWPEVLERVHMAYNMFINNTDKTNNQYACSIMCLSRFSRVRVHAWKIKKNWMVSKEHYKARYFPDYCFGSSGTFIPRTVAKRLLDASLLVGKVFKIDDVYISGLLRQTACVTIVEIGTADFEMKYMLHRLAKSVKL